jgi:hypothetical protein
LRVRAREVVEEQCGGLLGRSSELSKRVDGIEQDGHSGLAAGKKRMARAGDATRAGDPTRAGGGGLDCWPSEVLSWGGGLVLCGRAAGVGAGGEEEWSWRKKSCAL